MASQQTVMVVADGG